MVCEAERILYRSNKHNHIQLVNRRLMNILHRFECKYTIMDEPAIRDVKYCDPWKYDDKEVGKIRNSGASLPK